LTDLAAALDGVDLMEEEYQVLNRYGSGHRRNDGFYIGKTSEKLHPIENPEDIIVQSAGLMMHTLFSEPMLLILTDPRTDHPGNSIFELMSFFPYTTDSFVLTWILCVPVCCRPLRKVDTFLFLNILNQLTKVVQLVKLEKDPCAAFCFDHRSQITLDDANDVGMIQEADTAVCISGFQIMQFMTAQFRFLERLLMFMETEAINE
ncbi:BnaAnng23560D, partial [Brassica napus]